jgi:hypothetical protein
VPLGRFIEVLQSSAFHSPLYLMKGEQIINDDFEPRFSLALQAKDLRLAQEAASDQRATMPVSDCVRKLFAAAVRAGRGDKDVAAVADLLLEWTRTAGGGAPKAKGASKPTPKKGKPAKRAPKAKRPVAKKKAKKR